MKTITLKAIDKILANHKKNKFGKKTKAETNILIPKTLKKDKSFEGANKIITRNLINDAITVRYGDIGCLPSIKAEFERLMLKTTPKGINFIAHEWEDLKYFALTELVAKLKLPISVNRGSIGKWLMKLTTNELTNLILDYCGCVNTFKTEIEHCFDNKVIGVNGVLAMTFCLNDVHYKKGVIGEMFETIDETMFGSEHNITHLGIMLFLNSLLTKDKNIGHYKVEKVFPYSDKNPDTNKGMNMILIIVRRIK